MSERIEINAPDFESGNEESAGSLADGVIASFHEESVDYSGDPEGDSVATIARDVEHFTRMWVGRIRRLIHRSAQLLERESLLASSITRLNQQQAEWTRRTEAKEQALQEQTQLLTEGWLEVEAQRRKAFQGGRSSRRSNKQPTASTVVSTPGQTGSPSPVVPPPSVPDSAISGHAAASIPAVGVPPNQDSLQSGNNTEWLNQNSPDQASTSASSVAESPAPQPSPPVSTAVTPGPVTSGPAKAPPLQPVVPKGRKPITPAPVTPAPVANTSPNSDDPDSIQAQAKDRLEEFKRMQRALRANRNN